ncbi:MAG: binding domain protein excisionase family [Bacilli bacterium]|nr:binding domain protein excisionase family [Bacilli bacterium]
MIQKTLTVTDVARLLGVSTVTIYILVRELKIPHFRVRSRILFRLESINEWIDQMEGKVVPTS